MTGYTPAEQAIRAARGFPHAQNVTVGDAYISMYHRGRYQLLIMPAEPRAQIRAIDHREPVEPFTFDLDYPAVPA